MHSSECCHYVLLLTWIRVNIQRIDVCDQNVYQKSSLDLNFSLVSIPPANEIFWTVNRNHTICLFVCSHLVKSRRSWWQCTHTKNPCLDQSNILSCWISMKFYAPCLKGLPRASSNWIVRLFVCLCLSVQNCVLLTNKVQYLKFG